MKRRQITIKVKPSSTLLHLVGSCGVMPQCPPGFELLKVTTRGDKMTFYYVQEKRGHA